MSDYIYDTKHIAAGRKTKWCECCDKTIKVGEPSITITAFQGEFVSYDVCSTKCEKKFIKNYNSEENE